MHGTTFVKGVGNNMASYWFCQKCLKDIEGDCRYNKETGMCLCAACEKKEVKPDEQPSNS